MTNEISVMMNEMMAECCGDTGKPDFNKMKTFMEKCEKQDFSEEELATMCEATRFAFEKHCCGPEGTLDAKQLPRFMEVVMKDCECCAASKPGVEIV